MKIMIKNKKFKKFDLLYGDKGLKQTMNYKKWNSFSYKSNIVEKYGRIFDINDTLHKYSPKIAEIIKLYKNQKVSL